MNFCSTTNGIHRTLSLHKVLSEDPSGTIDPLIYSEGGMAVYEEGNLKLLVNTYFLGWSLWCGWVVWGSLGGLFQNVAWDNVTMELGRH